MLSTSHPGCALPYTTPSTAIAACPNCDPLEMERESLIKISMVVDECMKEKEDFYLPNF
ncbi:hypothetical protein BO443_10030 [Burkholderia orbicola]